MAFEVFRHMTERPREYIRHDQIIRRITARQSCAISVAESRADIEKKIRPEIARDAVANLRKGATVQMDDGFFGPAAPSPGLTPGSVNPPPATK